MASPNLAEFRSMPWYTELRNQTDLLVDTREIPNEFFKTTLHQNNGVKKYIFRYRKPPNLPPNHFEGYLILQLGIGVTGQPEIAHGGFLATVIDEVTGGLVGAAGLDQGYGMFTAFMKLEYHQPVRLPGVILAVAKVVQVEGRKVFLEATIKDESGVDCTTATVLFVRKRPSLY